MFNISRNFQLIFGDIRYLIHHQRCQRFHKLSYIHRLGKEPLKALTIGQVLEEKSHQYGERTAIISKHQNKSLSFLEVLEQSDKLAAGLCKIGLNYGDKVGIWAPNTVEWYLTYMACARAGFIMVCLNPLFPAHEIEYCINKVGIKAIISTDELKTQNYCELLKSIIPELGETDPGKLKSKTVPSLENIIIFSENPFVLKGASDFNEVLQLATPEEVNTIKRDQHKIQSDDPCHIQFTSGTTGKPKAPISTHFNLVNNSYQWGIRSQIHLKHHTFCCMVPFFHVFGTDTTICSCLNHGATLVIPAPSFSAKKCLDAIVEEKCTIVNGTPTMYIDLIQEQKRRNEDVIHLEHIVLGAAPATPQLIHDLEKHFKVKQIKGSYGMTECTSVTFQTLPEDSNNVSVTSVGVLVDHLEAKVIDEDGRIVKRGVPGELCIRGFSTTIGYWDDEERTTQLISKDRWLRTGDRFIIKEDCYGVIVGRIKDMILRGGENIFPKEIEELLSTHPDVLECHVIGLPHDRLGEEVCACVRLVEGAVLTLEDVRKFCEGKLARFKIPSAFRVVKEYPKTASGKIQKFRMVDIFSLNQSK